MSEPHTEREDQFFLSNFVKDDHLSPRQWADTLALATDLFRYGRMQVSDAVAVARRTVLGKRERGRFH